MELNIRRLAVPFAAALVTVVAASGIGAALIQWLERLTIRNDRGVRHEIPVELALLVGFPVYGSLAFLIANMTTHRAAMLVPCVAGIAALVSQAGRLTLTSLREGARCSRWVGAAFVICALTAMLLAQLPVISLDDAAYHLAIPKQWALEGHAVSFPLMSHSWFPLGAESSDIPLFALLGSSAPLASHMAHALLALATGLLLLGGMRRVAPSLGPALAVAVATTPALLLGAGWSGNDVLLTGVSFALLVALLDESTQARSGTIAAAIAAGLLLKYSFIPLAFTLCAVALVVDPPRRASTARAALFGATLGSVFFLRNLILTWNPIAPFLSGEGGEISGFRRGESLSETALSYLFDGRWVDDTLGVALLALLLMFPAIASSIRDRRIRVCGWALFAVVVLLIAMAPAGRILIPFLTTFAWIVACGLEKATEGRTRVRATVGALLALASFLQLGVAAAYLSSLDPLAIARGAMSDASYVALQRKDAAAVEWCNAQLPSSARALILGMQEIHGFDVRARGGGSFDGPRLARYLDAASPDELGDRLRADGITHVVLFESNIVIGTIQTSTREAQRQLRIDRRTAANLRQFLSSEAVQIANREGVSVYEARAGR